MLDLPGLRKILIFGVMGVSCVGMFAAKVGPANSQFTADVIVYGGTPAGIMAAVEAGSHGKRVLLLERSQHIGGMMTNGLGYTDRYADKAIGGLPASFFQQVLALYGGKKSVAGKASAMGHLFEPHIAEAAFEAMLDPQPRVTVMLGVSLGDVQMTGRRIASLDDDKGVTYAAAEFIDASYTGDLMAAAHVSYTVGRESSGQYGEDLAGVGPAQRMGNQPLSPYMVAGDSTSGLIAHVNAGPLAAAGSEDKTLMGYNYRVCLSSDPANQIPIQAPDNYDAAEYELMGRIALAENPVLVPKYYLDANSLPNQKFDWNNTRSFFSSDDVGANKGYADGGGQKRAQLEARQRHYQQGLFYFLATDPRIPADVQNWVRGMGLCKDEFTDNGGWPRQIYVREARRMLGTYVLTEQDLKLQTVIVDSIGLGGYASDDHLHHIVAMNGGVSFENSRGFQPTPYPIPYRVLTHRMSETTNLLVPVAVSASHTAYDSLRIETTYMIMGQAAGAGASLAIDESVPVQRVDTGALQTLLVGEGVVVAF